MFFLIKPYQKLILYPRAKYVPVIRHPELQTEDKTSWSFPNSRNLYGLHKAKDAIRESGIAIIFEGAKSVMLAHQYGHSYSVATHTYGAHLNHISMLIECGAKEIVLAFDRQYQDEKGKQYELYEHKTKELAKKIGTHCKISRITAHNDEINYKDAPIDCGEQIFNDLFNSRELLTDSMEIKKAEPADGKIPKGTKKEPDIKEMNKYVKTIYRTI